MKIFKGPNRRVFAETEVSTEFVYHRIRNRLPTDSLQRLALNFCIFDRPETWLRVTSVESSSGILGNNNGRLAIQLPHKLSIHKALLEEKKEEKVKSGKIRKEASKARKAGKVGTHKGKAKTGYRENSY